MSALSGKVKPFLVVNTSAELYGTNGYPLGGTNPPPSNIVSAPAPPGGTNPGPLPGTNCINLLTLRDYYKIPYPPTTPLASPPVVAVVSFGGGIYGQPVSSGKYSGFWRCTDISGSNGAPIQILVAPINGAINAPNADDGGATLENTVDVATISSFYGMVNLGNGAPVYTPPVIILYIAPSDDISEMYKTFYTVLNNPVVCNGQSYMPSVVCCSWGAPEISWTQKKPFPNDGEEIDNDPNPEGIAELNEINDLLADATKRGINICVASGDINLPNIPNQSSLEPPKIMFPASSPYVTSVGGSSVFFPNGPVRNYTNPGEFAWARADGGVSSAFPIPDYQTAVPGAALISADAFVTASQRTAFLLETALGEAYVYNNNNDTNICPSEYVYDNGNDAVKNASYAYDTKNAAVINAQAAYDSAYIALMAATAAANNDASVLQLQLALNAANTALTTAKAIKEKAKIALETAKDAVVKACALEVLLNESGWAYSKKLDDVADLDKAAASSSALQLANDAVAQRSSSVFAPGVLSDSSVDLADLVSNAANVANDLVVPYDSFISGSSANLANLVNVYSSVSSFNNTRDHLTSLKDSISSLQSDASGYIYDNANNTSDNSYDDNADNTYYSNLIAEAAATARLALKLNDGVTALVKAKVAWNTAKENADDASGNLKNVNDMVPAATPAQLKVARDSLSAANKVLVDATVLLTNTEYYCLDKVNDAQWETSNLSTDCDSSGTRIHFSGQDASGQAFYKIRKDASGANVAMSTAQNDMGLYVYGTLEDIAGVVKSTFQEAWDRHNYWDMATDVSGNDVPVNIVAANNMIAAATRTLDAAKALQKIFDNNQIHSAISDWTTGPPDSSANTAIGTAVTKLQIMLDQTYSKLISNTPLAGDSISQSILTDASGALNTAINLVTTAVNYFEGPDPTSYMNNLPSDVATSLSKVLNVEGQILAITQANAGITIGDAKYSAAYSSYYAVKDEFTLFNDTLAILYTSSKLALNLADIAHKSIQTSAPRSVIDGCMLAAQNAAYNLVAASTSTNQLFNYYSSITPALVDAAIMSRQANSNAAYYANLATAAGYPAPVTPQFLEKMQALVLEAKAQAQLTLEADPTNSKLMTLLSGWNTAVSAGAAALNAISQVDISGTLFDIIVSFYTAIFNAVVISVSPQGVVTLGDYVFDDNVPEPSYYSAAGLSNTSSLTLAATKAFNHASSTFFISVTQGNLKYLMDVANTAITAAEQAADVSNSLLTDASHARAKALWSSAASKIEAYVGQGNSYFNSNDAYNQKLQLPFDLMNTVALAYQQTTNLGVSGSITGSINTSGSPVLTVTSIDGSGTGFSIGGSANTTTLDTSGSLVNISGNLPGSTLTFHWRDASSNYKTYVAKIVAQLTNTEGPGGVGTSLSKGADGTYSLEFVSGDRPTASHNTNLQINTNLASVTPSETNSTSDAYVKSVAAYNAFLLAYKTYNIGITYITNLASNAAQYKADAQVAIALALASAARVQAAAKLSSQESSAMATGTMSIQDDAAYDATEAAYAAADNVNMYRCIPDIAMHADADDLPVIYRLNGGNVYVGGTSVAAAMFAGFLAVTQSHSPINYFMNPVLYGNYTYPSPLFYDISGTNELLNPTVVTGRYNWVVSEVLDDPLNSNVFYDAGNTNLHGSYNTRVGLGSVRGNGLSAFLETPQMVTDIRCGPYPVDSSFNYDASGVPATITTIRVQPGITYDVYAFVRPTAAYNTNVVWSCSSPYNATVTQTLETYQNVEVSSDQTLATAYRARVTGLVPVDPLSPLPVITVTTTDGSNMFTTINVNVLAALAVTGVSISALNEIKNPSNSILLLGNTLQLIATVTPVAATNKAVYWWSSNTSIVNVDPNGLLTPLSPGHVTIRVTTVNNNISASISVYVPTPMTGISVMPTMITLNPSLLVYPLKNTQLLKASVTPSNVDYKYVKWSIVSSQPLALPPGTTDTNGIPLLYNGGLTEPSAVNVVSPVDIRGNILKRDSNGNIIDNTQATVTGLTNGRVVLRVSTDGAPDTVYGTYSADVTVNVVTPITNVTLEQTNMVIALNPSVSANNGPLGIYASAGLSNPLLSTFKAVNSPVNVQYSSLDANITEPWLNAEVADRNLPQSYDVKATLFPAYPSNMNLIWTSSNPKVAIVSNNTAPVLNSIGSDPNNGLFQVTEQITPLSNGSTVISVTTADGNKVASVNVTVTTPVTNIILSPMPITLNPGKQYALQATVIPTTATITDLVWESTNVAVARVDQYGVVTAVSTGSCGISVTTADGDYTAMATINVVTPLVGVSLVLNTPTPIRIGDLVQILVVMTPTTASDQAFTWTVTNGVNGNIFTNGPPQNGNIVYLDAAQAGSSVFTVTTHDGMKQASIALTVSPY